MSSSMGAAYMLKSFIFQDMDAAWSELLSAEATRSKAINAQIREYVILYAPMIKSVNPQQDQRSTPKKVCQHRE